MTDVFEGSEIREGDEPVVTGRDQLMKDMFTLLLFASDCEAWRPIADQLAPRSGHLRLIFSDVH